MMEFVVLGILSIQYIIFPIEINWEIVLDQNEIYFAKKRIIDLIYQSDIYWSNCVRNSFFGENKSYKRELR